MKKILIYLAFVIYSSSCTYVYYPTYPVVTDTEEKGFGMQGVVGLSKAQLGAWYAIDSHFFVTGVVSGALSILGTSSNSSGTGNNNGGYRSLTSMLGAGYKIRASDNFEFQIQAGLGGSKGFFHTNVFNSPTDTFGFTDFSTVDVSTRSMRGFLQPTFGFINEKVNFYFIPRFTYEAFNNVTQKSDLSSNINLNNRNFLITEGYMLLRFKTEVINIDLFTGIATNLFSQINNGDIEDSFVAQPFHFGFGLSKTFN